MPESSRSVRRGMVAVAGVVAILAAGIVWQGWSAPARAQAPSASVHAAQPAAAAASSQAPREPAGPGGLSQAQWRTIQDRVEPGPQHDRELARIADLLEFQRHVARLRELRGDPAAVDERRALARGIDAGIATHLALREITGGEAVLLETAALAELEPDSALRARRLEAWRSDWLSAHPPAVDARVAEYQRQEAAAVASWQSGPASQRDPAELARRLQRLQVAVFDPLSPGGR